MEVALYFLDPISGSLYAILGGAQRRPQQGEPIRYEGDIREEREKREDGFEGGYAEVRI